MLCYNLHFAPFKLVSPVDINLDTSKIITYMSTPKTAYRIVMRFYFYQYLNFIDYKIDRNVLYGVLGYL